MGIGDPAPSPKRDRNPQFSAHFSCGQTAAWIKMPLGTENGGMPQPRRHCLRWGHSSPSPKRGQSHSPQFSAHVCCGQMAGWIKMALGVEVGLGSDHIAVDGDSAPLPKKGQSPQFSAHLYCGQTAGCIKMPLGVEVGLSPGDCVRWGPNPLPKRGQSPPIFGPCLLWPNGWMDQDATWYRVRPQPKRHCVTWGPSSPSKKSAQPLSFRPMSVVAKWLYVSG